MAVTFCLKLPEAVEMHITTCGLAVLSQGGLSQDASRVLVRVLHCRCMMSELPEADW